MEKKFIATKRLFWHPRTMFYHQGFHFSSSFTTPYLRGFIQTIDFVRYGNLPMSILEHFSWPGRRQHSLGWYAVRDPFFALLPHDWTLLLSMRCAKEPGGSRRVCGRRLESVWDVEDVSSASSCCHGFRRGKLVAYPRCQVQPAAYSWRRVRTMICRPGTCRSSWSD